MFRFFKKHSETTKPSPEKPPVDLNKPVENPRLVAAMHAFSQSRTPATQEMLTQALRTAIFLVPILTDEMHSTPSDDNGQMTIQAGSRIKIITCFDDAGGNHLALFTDWPSIRNWTDMHVSTLVMPASEAFEFALSDQHAGAVVNPGDNALPLDKKLLDYLFDRTDHTNA
jgi:hypothetical protein